MKTRINKAIEFLLARGNLPILFWLKKDILEVPVDREHKNLQKFAARIRILESQRPNGGWTKKRYEKHPHFDKTYYIVDTLRNSFQLYNYGCGLEEDGVKKALDFLFSTQTAEGDFRGAYLNEYAPTYHALTLEILCMFGLDADKRVEKGFKWLLDNRQDDGGWVIPYRTIDKAELKKRYNYEAQMKLDSIKADPKKPFAHLVTGMALRAFAASNKRRHSEAAKNTGELIISRFFKPDAYEDRQQAYFWKEMTFPFWATDILSSLDALAKVGFTVKHEGIQQALNWLLRKQTRNGYWEAGFKKSTIEDHLWVTMSVLKVLKSFRLTDL